MGEDFTAAHPDPGGVARGRSHPAIVAAIVFAWLLLAAGALVVVAHLLGWWPKSPGLPMVGSEATRENSQPAASKKSDAPAPAARTQSGVVLLPGETLVEAPDTRPPAVPAPAPRKAPPAPVKPTYAKPAPPPVPTRSAETPTPRAAPPAPRDSGFGPQPPPQYSRAEIRDRSDRSICINCATITSIQPRGDRWEVAVRFEDGSREVIRYYDPPRMRVGDAVHLEDGRLILD